MSITWLKLHHDIIHDIKLRRFSPQEKWAWIVLLILASESKERGFVLADDEDIADMCEFNSTQDWLYYRDKLIAKGMVEMTISGLQIANWEERQHIKPSDRPEATKERKRRQRAREKDALTEVSRDVTPLSRDGHDTDKDIDLDKDLEEDLLREHDRYQISENESIEIAAEPIVEPSDFLSSLSGPSDDTGTTNGTEKLAGDDSAARDSPKKENRAERHEEFRQFYNDHKPASFAAIQTLNSKRKKTINQLVTDCGGVEEALAVLRNALDYAASDSWYSTKNLTFENFSSNGKIIQLHERLIAKLDGSSSYGRVVNEADLRFMQEYQRLSSYYGAPQ